MKNKPFTVIAGPCVIEGGDGGVNLETANQVKAIIQKLSKTWDIQFYFKSSYDKANRTSIDSYRGPGLKKGLEILSTIKENVRVPILTDVHSPEEVEQAAEVVDFLQIPAFLCRQTDLLVKAGQTGLPVNIKKGQFLSPLDAAHCANKVKSTGNQNVYITERGTTFGYNNLVVDMRSVPMTHSLGLPLIFDATHSCQLPGGQGASSGGNRDYAPILARAAVAAGCDGLFFETHPEPEKGLSDSANMIPVDWVEDLLTTCLEIQDVTRKQVRSSCNEPSMV